MSPYSYFVVQQPLGWMALLATTKGLRRLSLKPQPQEALDALGPSLELATLEPKVFESVLKQFDRYFKGQNDALDPIELDIEKSSPFFEASYPFITASLFDISSYHLLRFLKFFNPISCQLCLAIQ